jgi:hypothetical protein
VSVVPVDFTNGGIAEVSNERTLGVKLLVLLGLMVGDLKGVKPNDSKAVRIDTC